ncbi:hypothetical protein A0H81_01402 [Grifola frondosa]|uniref:Uncharacterized protein n=1 Tax=Grifola frondosa TaxID=5627 RepID=A0A1C7MSZ1_GRIFR|nr:hypothetical protein A0H81_01402 [Grifola frondosa]
MTFAAFGQKHQPEHRNLVHEGARVLCKRMERRQTVENDRQDERRQINDKGDHQCSTGGEVIGETERYDAGRQKEKKCVSRDAGGFIAFEYQVRNLR